MKATNLRRPPSQRRSAVKTDRKAIPPKTRRRGAPQSSFASVVGTHKREVRACYENALKRHENLSGKVEIELTVSGSGRVTRAALAHNDVGAGVGKCIVRRAKRWQFARQSQDITLSFPFVFTPAG